MNFGLHTFVVGLLTNTVGIRAKEIDHYSVQKWSEFRFRDRCLVFFLLLRCGNYYGLFLVAQYEIFSR